MERNLLLQSCLKCVEWGIVEMSILLSDDIVEFILPSESDSEDLIDIHAPKIDVKLKYLHHSDLFIPLLIAKCPVSNGI